MALTAKRIATLRKVPGRYLDGGDLGRSLYLQVTPKMVDGKPTEEAGGASWLLRYELKAATRKTKHGNESDRRERWLGLGSLADFDLKEARKRARAARQMLADGNDPLDIKHAERKARLIEAAATAAKDKSFKFVAEKYFDFHSPSWKNAKHRAQFLSSLETYAFPIIGALPVAAIDKTLVLQVLQPIWQSKNETASRVRGRVENVLDYAKVNGWREGDNPAAWSGHLEHALPSPSDVQKIQEHHPALAYDDMPTFIAALRQRQGDLIIDKDKAIRRIGVAALALEFTILTAARTGETVGARRDEIDFGNKTWFVPAGRIKGGREHRVSLSDRAIEILKSLPHEDGSDFVFIGAKQGTHLSNSAMAAMMKKKSSLAFPSTSPGRLATVHGMRSTFKDWCMERTSYPTELSEIALAHAVGDKVETAYRRGDMLAKRHRLMEEWARFCGSPQMVKGAKVVPLRGYADDRS